MEIHVGCSGWFYSHWRGVFYPPHEITTKQWFAYYSNVFETVELNAPFYHWPKPATVRRWKREARPGFIYSVKVNQSITHQQRMRGTAKRVRAYYDIAEILGEKMGCFLFQFPPSFKFSKSDLRRIVTQLDPLHRNVVEFRHKSWWRPEVYEAFALRGITFCAVSAPRLPVEFPASQKTLYVRLSGVTKWYQHDYSPEELALWTERILRAGSDQVWIYFNNDRRGYAIKNALALRRQLRAATSKQAIAEKSELGILTADRANLP